MRRRHMFSRLVFLALALGIVVSLPIQAQAEDVFSPCASLTAVAAVSAPLGSSRDAPPSRTDYLRLVYQETDSGRPRAGTTRAQYIQILYRAAGEPKVKGTLAFLDVSADSPYADALLWAQQTGVARHNREKRFRPNEEVTNESAQEFLTLALASLGESVQQVANSLMAAYLGKINEEDWALTPAALAEVLEQSMYQVYLPNYTTCALSGTPPEPTPL